MKSLTEPILAGITLLMIGIVIGTKNVAMSDMTSAMVAGFFAAVLFGYVALVHSEKPADEREQAISMIASKYAHIVGALVLSAGIIVQSIDHDLDIWLPIALGAMVFTKLVTLFIHNR